MLICKENRRKIPPKSLNIRNDINMVTSCSIPVIDSGDGLFHSPFSGSNLVYVIEKRDSTTNSAQEEIVLYQLAAMAAIYIFAPDGLNIVIRGGRAAMLITSYTQGVIYRQINIIKKFC